MVTEAWIETGRPCETVHPVQSSSGTSVRTPITSEGDDRGRFHGIYKIAVQSVNYSGEHSLRKDEKGKICHSDISISSPADDEDFGGFMEGDSRTESRFLAATERRIKLSKPGHVCKRDCIIKTGVTALYPNAVATGANMEMTSGSSLKDAVSGDHLINDRHQSADAIEEPQFLEVLRDKSSAASSKVGEGSYKHCADKDSRIIMCGDLSSVTDVQGIPWDTNAGMEFTKSATYRTPEKIPIAKSNVECMTGRRKMKNNNNAQTKSIYSERYGIDSKCFPAVINTSGNNGIKQRSAHTRPMSVSSNSSKGNRRVSTSAGMTFSREAAFGRRASIINLLPCRNMVLGNRLKEDDPFRRDAQSDFPVAKGGQQRRRPSGEVVLDQPLTWTGNSTVPADDVNNNREHKFQFGDTPWITHESAPKDCTPGNTIILSATPGANLTQGPEGNDHVCPVGIRAFSSKATAASSAIVMSHWLTVKRAILSWRQKDSLPPGTTNENVERSVTAHQNEMDAPKVRQPARPKTVSRKLDRPQQHDTRNVPTEGDGEPQAATTSLIEDPILVKVSKRNRNVGKFTCIPDPIPNAVCFEIAGTGLRHQDVKHQVENLLQKFPEVKIIGIQFHNRALVNNQQDMNNRWIITTNSSVGCQLLVGNSLIFDGHEVQLRLYDEVINTEYQRFVRMMNFVKLMDTRKILS